MAEALTHWSERVMMILSKLGRGEGILLKLGWKEIWKALLSSMKVGHSLFLLFQQKRIKFVLGGLLERKY